MNFAGAKENIQPLAAGRNVEQLEVALNAESHPECQEELLKQRKQYEQDILNYAGDDPLDLWFDYVTWVEQSYPKSGKESALDDLLKKCLSTFEKVDRYKQDPRFIRLFIKYIDAKKTPNLYYTKLYNNGVGTMVADLYIAWAHYYDIIDNFEQAKEVYEKGLAARAAPIEQLKQVYERFQFSVGQRVVRKDAYRQEFLTTMEEQRNAFTSLRSLKRSKVGSIRTGSAVKSYVPGQVRQNEPLMSSNAQFNVYEGASQVNEKTQPPRTTTSVVEDIENSQVENNIEPGPWSKASNRKSVFHNTNHTSALKFAILEDEDIKQPSIKFGPLPPDDGIKNINVARDFARKNGPQTPFVVPLYAEDNLPPNALRSYDSFFLHPNKDVSFTSDELRWYRRCKQMNVVNEFTERQDKLWGMGSSVPARIPPRFVRNNQPCVDMETERPEISSIPETQHFLCKLSEIYPVDSKDEWSIEELLKQKYLATSIPNNDGMNESMDETICVRGRQSFGVKHMRKSIVAGGRKSIMPLANDKGSVTLKLPPVMDDSSSDMEIDDLDGPVGTVNKDVKSCEPISNHQAATVFTAQNDIESKGVGSLPKSRWSIFNDEESSASPTTPTDDEQTLNKKGQSPPVVGWSIFKDEDAQSPLIFSNETGADSSVKTKDIFAVPHTPLSSSTGLAEKRTLDPAAKSSDFGTPVLKRTFVEPQLPMGPHTGAIKKSIRKSSITENAVYNSSNFLVVNPSSTTENAFKSPGLIEPVKCPESAYLDYSLCTAKFNVNLAEQMVSTPVATRRLEALTEQLRAQDTQPLNPLKLSTIMETTEGSAHTASTKSSTQFSSPEEDDLSKRSNVTNRTKFIGVTLGSDSDASGACKNDFQPGPIDNFNSYVHQHVGSSTNYSCNVEKTLPTVQMSLLLDGAPAAINKTEIKKNDVASKNYPFPIFEDTQMANVHSITTTTTTTLPKSTLGESLLNFLSASPEPQCQFLPLPLISIPLAPEPSGPLQLSSHDEFNMPSLWIKDEPVSITENASVREESFAMPNMRQLVAEPSKMTANETVNNCEDAESLQGKSHPQNLELNDSVAEESFAIPKIRPSEVVAQPTVGELHQTKEEQQTFQLDASVIDISFAMPNIRQSEVVAQPTVGELLQTKEEQQTFQLDVTETDESFAIPNIRPSKVVAQPTVGELHQTKEEKQSFQLDASVSDISFALSNPRQGEVVAQPTVGELHQTKEEQQTFQLDASVSDISFAMPNTRQSEVVALPTVGELLQTKEEQQTFQLDVTVTDESFAIPKIRTSEVVAQPTVGELHQTKEAQPIFQLDDTVTESFAIPNVARPISTDVGCDRTFDLVDSSDDSESEEEIIEVPDVTLLETVPKIVQVESLAGPDVRTKMRSGMDRISISMTEDEIAAQTVNRAKNAEAAAAAVNNAADCDQSIYFKHNSINLEPSWIENDVEKALPDENNIYQHENANLEESRIYIETKLAEPIVNPFEEVLKKAILQELAFIHTLEQSEFSQLVMTVPPVTVKRTIPFKDTYFDVLNCIGHGAYGRVYSVKSAINGAMYAVKKEMPANLWECYILNEVQRRIVKNMLPAYMKIDYAIIGNTGSLIFSEYSPYGTLLDVCNRVFTSMHNNVNETIVFILAYQMLELIHHLHEAEILHLDLKPDNFLIMKQMSSNHEELFIQLIDFGNAVDMQQFKRGQDFTYALETKHFVCIEMAENRSWIYQPDLYCLAGTIHSVLFGKYMEVQKDGSSYGIKMKVPRYCNRTVWNRFFRELINIENDSPPDLQDMKNSFREAIISDKKLEDKIKEFNRFIMEKPKKSM